jgi:hypothetical protein
LSRPTIVWSYKVKIPRLFRCLWSFLKPFSSQWFPVGAILVDCFLFGPLLWCFQVFFGYKRLFFLGWWSLVGQWFLILFGSPLGVGFPLWFLGLSVVGVPSLPSFVWVPFGLVGGLQWLIVRRQLEASSEPKDPDLNLSSALIRSGGACTASATSYSYRVLGPEWVLALVALHLVRTLLCNLSPIHKAGFPYL